MGNKQSSGRGDGAEGVKKRSKKDGKKKKKDRPLSTPGYVDEDPGGPPSGNDMRRSASVDMGIIQQTAEVNFYEDMVVGTSDLAGETVFNIYKRNLHQLLTTWPEFTPLTEIDPKKTKAEVLEALQKVYDIAFTKNNLSDALTIDKKNLNDFIKGLQARFDRQVDDLRKKDNEISDLDHSVSILQGELRKRGIAPKIPPPEEPRGDYDLDYTLGRDDTFSRSSYKRHSAMMPTPFLQAGGPRGQSAAIKRSNSMQTEGRRVGGGIARAPETSTLVEDLNLKLRNLQHMLENKEKENINLRERIDSDFDAGSSFKKLAPHSGPNMKNLVDCFEDLEAQALSKVTDALIDILRDRSEGSVHQFLCFTMETAFLQASGLMKTFMGTIHSLLINPLNPGVTTVRDAESHGQIDKHMFEKSPDIHAMSRLARRTRLTTELPKYLEEEVASFIRVTSDSTNIEVLVEEVQQELQHKFPSYATKPILNSAIFADFLNACCRLSWQLCSLSPPCYVTIDDTRTRYDEYYHDVVPQQKTSKLTIGAEIDYFVWPMLLRKKNGEVLFRSRVALTQGQRL